MEFPPHNRSPYLLSKNCVPFLGNELLAPVLFSLYRLGSKVYANDNKFNNINIIYKKIFNIMFTSVNARNNNDSYIEQSLIKLFGEVIMKKIGGADAQTQCRTAVIPAA